MSDNYYSNIIQYVLANRGQPPVASGDQVTIQQRGDRYGNAGVFARLGSKMHPVADEGNFYSAVNPTPGTGVAGNATPTAFSDTAALLFLRNGDAQNGRRLYLHSLELMVTAPGTSSTSWNYVIKGDKSNTRYTSGGSQITPNNTNMATASNTPGIDRLQFGALTLAAAGAQTKTLAQGVVRTVIKQAGDKYVFTFGDSTAPPMSGIALDGSAQANVTIPCPPIILDPGDSFILHEWAPAQTVAAAYEFMLQFWVS